MKFSERLKFPVRWKIKVLNGKMAKLQKRPGRFRSIGITLAIFIFSDAFRVREFDLSAQAFVV